MSINKAVIAILVVIAVVLSAWFWFKAPCVVWSLTPAGEAPIRCVK